MLNLCRKRLPLKTVSGRLFTIDERQVEPLQEELELFLDGEDKMNSLEFSKKVMFTHELKANNTVEGINDSVSLIEKVIKEADSIRDREIHDRILNLYEGYKYILEGKEINPQNVRELYRKLSNGLLSSYDLTHMGEYYRNAPVFILKNGRLDGEIDQGIPEDLVPSFMDSYFEYANTGALTTQSDHFIRSQIMHFYFVYIHPYFDINGRTSRTVSMWYLLNNGLYPYIIFNRGISFDSSYDRVIRECKDSYDLTKFLKFMLVNVKKELEKEYVMRELRDASLRKWGTIDYQTVEYFLSMNGQKTILDFVRFYRTFNDKRKIPEILDMVLPLVEDGTLEVVRETKKCIASGQKNLVLALNKDRIDSLDRSKITRMNI